MHDVSQLYLSMAAAVTSVEQANPHDVCHIKSQLPHFCLTVLAVFLAFQSQIGCLMTLFSTAQAL
jgi:hypothetical protein